MAGNGTKATSSGIFGAAGFASAFGVAACCAIPMGLSAIGVGTSWLIPIVRLAEPHRQALTALALGSIVLSVVLVAVAARTCQPGDICARRGFRFTIYGMAVISAALLAVGYIYR
jgi:mercuric ion transport protein